MALLVPEFMQNSSYTAKRWREAMWRHSRIQAGAWDTSSFTVSAGSGRGVNVSGGAAFVSATLGATNTGLYHVEADAAGLSGTLTAAHATLPRIDQIAIQIDDTTDSASADDTPQILVATGTATAGATLGNRTGAATLPGNTLLLADVLVPGGSGSIAAATIRDRRTMARGVMSIREITSGDVAVTGGSTNQLALSRVNIGRSYTGISNMVELGVTCRMAHSVAASQGSLLFQTQANDSGTWVTIAGGRYHRKYFQSAGLVQQVHYFDTLTLTPLNYQIRVAATTTLSTLTVSASAASLPLRFYIREHVGFIDQTFGSSP